MVGSRTSCFRQEKAASCICEGTGIALTVRGIFQYGRRRILGIEEGVLSGAAAEFPDRHIISVAVSLGNPVIPAGQNRKFRSLTIGQGKFPILRSFPV